MAAEVLTPRGRERGMTLIEIMLALTILATVILGMGQFAFNFSRVERQSEARTIAVNLAQARLSQIRASTNYSGLATNFAGTETSITGFPGYTRTTTIVHTGGPLPTYTNDYNTVTVTVTSAALKSTVTKTVVVASP
ncbi:MAG TPA: prepilin-type N-terminal cleavage/methylation domain-containing protein [Gemmatimonadales bacterium]|nr:prepilin-type N-terminal cleavage/methylation domain-containing protein [Gemmatimonadales bacterium]